MHLNEYEIFHLKNKYRNENWTEIKTFRGSGIKFNSCSMMNFIQVLMKKGKLISCLKLILDC